MGNNTTLEIMSKQASKLAAMAVLSALSLQAADTAGTATIAKPAPKADVKKPASNATYSKGDWAITATMDCRFSRSICATPDSTLISAS